MFEKEAEEYANEYGQDAFTQFNMPQWIKPIRMERKLGFQKGAEFGYNKANEWHYVKDGDLPNTETKNYTYIRRRKRYERQLTDYRVIKCFVLCQNEKGKITAEVGYFNCNKKYFFDKAEGAVIAWKEIVPPKE